MTDKDILRMTLNLKDSVLDEKGKEEFLKKVEQCTRKVERLNTILCKTLSDEGRTEESHTKRNGQT